MTTETFTRDGKHHCTMTTRHDDGIVYQTTSYAADARPFRDAEPSCTEVSISLLDPSDDLDALIAAHKAVCARPDFRTDTKGGEAEWRAFLVQTKGSGCLNSTTRAPLIQRAA